MAEQAGVVGDAGLAPLAVADGDGGRTPPTGAAPAAGTDHRHGQDHPDHQTDQHLRLHPTRPENTTIKGKQHKGVVVLTLKLLYVVGGHGLTSDGSRQWNCRHL